MDRQGHEKGHALAAANAPGPGPAYKLTVQYAYGSSAPKIDPLLSFSSLSGNKDFSDRLIYKIGRRLCVYDPEMKTQEFFNVRPKNVVDILHYTISSNGRYISMCEAIRHDKQNGEHASQVSIYLMSTYNLLNTCHYPITKPFICSTFCGDRDCKQVAALSEDPDRIVVIWHWDKEKVHKMFQVNVGATLLRCAPCPALMLTTSGPAAMKCWCTAPDGSIKPSNLLPPAKELLDNYIDHMWMPMPTHTTASAAAMSQYRLIALVDPDPNNEINRNRKQCIYVLEGKEQLAGSNSSSSSTAANVPLAMELRQSLLLKLETGVRAEKLVLSGKGFVVIGDHGLIIVYDRTDDKSEPFVESKRLTLGRMHLFGATVYPGVDKMVVLTRTNRLLTLAMDVQAEQLTKTLAKHEQQHQQHHGKGLMKHANNGSDSNSAADAAAIVGHHSVISDLTKGGYHPSEIVSGDLALERPLLITIGKDNLARVWNYYTGKCETVHHFLPTEEASACAMHPNGLHVLIALKDRIRMYNVLLDKLRPAKETVLKNVKALKYSHGAQYFAAAASISVYVYDTTSMTQLATYTAHLQPVTRLSWAPGDQVLFSGGVDGNVYGWQIAFGGQNDGGGSGGGHHGGNTGRMEVITATNRSAPIHDLVVDSLPTVFRDNASGQSSSDESNDANANGADGNGNSWTQWMNYARSLLIVTSRDGHMRLPTWSMGGMSLKNNNSGDDEGYTHTNNAVAIQNNSSNVASGNNNSNSLVSTNGCNPTGRYPTMDGTPTIFGDVAVTITAVCLSPDRTKLFAGTSLGSIRVYSWPPDPQYCAPNAPNPNQLALSAAANNNNANNANNIGNAHMPHISPTSVMAMYHHMYLCYEVYTHKEAVICLGVGARPNMLVSAAMDGSVFIQQLTDERPFNVRRAQSALSLKPSSNGSGNAIFDPFEDEEEAAKKLLNDDIVLLASEDVEEHVNQVVELQKLLAETRAQNEFQARKLEVEHNDNLKKITDSNEAVLQKERDVFERQRNNYESRIRDLISSIESKDADHAKIVTQMENQYEHRLADQIMRYDLLSEKMQLLKQKCEGLVKTEREKFASQLAQLRAEHASTIKRLQSENRRAIEEKATNENSYKQIIVQQEDEYEDELRALISAAEKELVSERELVTRLRTAMAEKQTQYDHLKKKFEELQRASRARMELLAKESAEKKKHMDTIEHYKKNLAEREEALAEKEKVVLELRSKTRTLENFRFVLDHRLQQLSSERGPITSHIEGLEKHIATMYEEMVDEFAAKKVSVEANQLKDQKISWLSQDLNKMRATVREKEQYIAGFKREVGNIVTSMVVGKELEESIHSLYKKFVKGEGDDGSSMNNTSNNNGTNANKSTVKGRGLNSAGGGVRMSAKAQEVVSELLQGAPGNALLKHTLGGTNMYNNNNNGGNSGGNNAHVLSGHPDMMIDDQSFMSMDTGAIGQGVGFSKNLIREVEEALVDTAKEAARQMDHLEDRANKLKKRLRSTQKEATITSRHRLHENSDLLFECNDLRAENKELQRKIGLLRHDLEMAQRNNATLRQHNNNNTANNAPVSANSNHNFPMDFDSNLDINVHHEVNPLDPNANSDTNGELAAWVVHSGMKGGQFLAPSHSANQLHNSNNPKSNKNKLSASMSALPTHDNHINVSGLKNATVSLTANNGSNNNFASPKNKTNTTNLTHNLMAKQIDRLNAAVESLAQQLDEANREKDLQRLEITKLRKLFTQQQIASHSSLSQQGSLVQNSQSVHKLPALLSSNLSNHPSVFSSGSNNNNNSNNNSNSNSLTHADITGQPSEQDKLAMRLTPQGSHASGSAGQKKSRNASVSSSRSGRPPKSADNAGESDRVGSGGVTNNNNLSHEFSLNSHEAPRGD